MYGIMSYLDCGCGLVRGGGISRCPAHQTDVEPTLSREDHAAEMNRRRRIREGREIAHQQAAGA